MYIKKRFESKKNEGDQPTAAEIFDERKEAALDSVEHLGTIVDSFQPTDRDADTAKLALIDYIKTGADNLVAAVEEKLGLKKNA